MILILLSCYYLICGVILLLVGGFSGPRMLLLGIVHVILFLIFMLNFVIKSHGNMKSLTVAGLSISLLGQGGISLMLVANQQFAAGLAPFGVAILSAIALEQAVHDRRDERSS